MAGEDDHPAARRRRARSRCSKPCVSTRPPGSKTRILPQMRIFGRDPAEIVPHAAVMRVDLGSESSGKARRRLRRARLVMPRRGPMVARQRAAERRRPIERQQSEQRRKREPPPKPADDAKIEARHPTTRPLGLVPRSRSAARGLRAEIAHAIPLPRAGAGSRTRLGTGEHRQDRRNQFIERSTIVPPDLDIQRLDPAPAHRGNPDDVLGRRDERGSCPLGVAAQPVELAVAERVMVREGRVATSARRATATSQRISPAGRSRQKRQTRAGEPLASTGASTALAAPAGRPLRGSERSGAHRRRAARPRRRGRAPPRRGSRNGPAGITRPLPKP